MFLTESTLVKIIKEEMVKAIREQEDPTVIHGDKPTSKDASGPSAVVKSSMLGRIMTLAARRKGTLVFTCYLNEDPKVPGKVTVSNVTVLQSDGAWDESTIPSTLIIPAEEEAWNDHGSQKDGFYQFGMSNMGGPK